MRAAQSLFILLTLSIAAGCLGSSKKNEVYEDTAIAESYFRHLSYLIQLKNLVAAESWPEFSRIDFNQPVVYYTTEGTYLFNPKQQIKSNS